MITRFTSRWSKGSAPRPTPSPNFVVSLKVGCKEFVGEGSTAQAAKHSAATKALQILKVISLLVPIRSFRSNFHLQLDHHFTDEIFYKISERKM